MITKLKVFNICHVSLTVLILLVVLIVGNVQAESQPSPPKAPQIKTQVKPYDTIKHQEPPGQTDKITNISVPIVPQVAPVIENGIAKKKAENREEHGAEFWPSLLGFRIKITDSLLVFFTAILALFTWFLHRSTRKLWKAGEEQMKITRASLQLAREEFTSAHRPRLILRNVTMKPPTHPALPIEEGKPVVVEGVVVNVGNTPAEIIESNVTVLVGGSMFHARTPFGPGSHNINGVKFVPGGAYTFCLTSERIDFKNSSDLYSLTKGDKVIYCFGFIMYRDAIGNNRRTAFCRRYDPNAERFTVVNDPDYEYTD